MQLGFYCLSRQTKIPADLQLKLARFKSNHNWFIFVTELNNYEIIKKGLLKV